jgi:hypothetical protein
MRNAKPVFDIIPAEQKTPAEAGVFEEAKIDDLSVPTAKHQQGAASQTQTGQPKR